MGVHSLTIHAFAVFLGLVAASRAEQPDTYSRVAPLTREALIDDALSAAPRKIARGAAVRNWDGTMVRQGNEDYICFPTPTEKRERGEHAPMCLDKVWLAWKEAWMRNEPFKAERVGIAYMLSAEATGGSIDPDAMKPASGDGLFVEGPQILLLMPDPAQLNAFSTDPGSGAAFVRWKDTPYAHLVIPVERSTLGR
jgi:hypothetical protein